MSKVAAVTFDALVDWAMDDPAYDALCVAYRNELGRDLSRNDLRYAAWVMFEIDVMRRARQLPVEYTLPHEGPDGWGELARAANQEYEWLSMDAQTDAQRADAMATAVRLVKLNRGVA